MGSPVGILSEFADPLPLKLGPRIANRIISPIPGRVKRATEFVEPLIIAHKERAKTAKQEGVDEPVSVGVGGDLLWTRGLMVLAGDSPLRTHSDSRPAQQGRQGRHPPPFAYELRRNPHHCTSMIFNEARANVQR